VVERFETTFPTINAGNFDEPVKVPLQLVPEKAPRSRLANPEE
jgi:hypothetical protein